MLLIISGNLSFLNWLTMVPSLACFDDASVGSLFSSRDKSIKARVLAMQREESKEKGSALPYGKTALPGSNNMLLLRQKEQILAVLSEAHGKRSISPLSLSEFLMLSWSLETRSCPRKRTLGLCRVLLAAAVQIPEFRWGFYNTAANLGYLLPRCRETGRWHPCGWLPEANAQQVGLGNGSILAQRVNSFP